MNYKKEELKINKSNSSYGNYSIRISNAEIKFFFKKTEAKKFIENYV